MDKNSLNRLIRSYIWANSICLKYASELNSNTITEKYRDTLKRRLGRWATFRDKHKASLITARNNFTIKEGKLTINKK